MAAANAHKQGLLNAAAAAKAAKMSESLAIVPYGTFLTPPRPVAASGSMAAAASMSSSQSTVTLASAAFASSASSISSAPRAAASSSPAVALCEPPAAASSSLSAASREPQSSSSAGAPPRATTAARHQTGVRRAADKVAVQTGLPLLHDAAALISRASALATSARGSVGARAAVEPDPLAATRDLRQLRKSVRIHIAILESTQARLAGEAELDLALPAILASKGSAAEQAAAMSEDSRDSHPGSNSVSEEEGIVDVSHLLQAIDFFRAAELAARGVDLESQAIALASQSRIYRDHGDLLDEGIPTSRWEVRNSEHRSYHLFREALHLAARCAPRSFLGLPWYDDTVTSVQQAREAWAREEEEEQEAKDEVLLAVMKRECKAVEEATKKGAVALFQHVYAKHPPRHIGKTPKELGLTSTSQQLQRTLRFAVAHYTPDKQRGAARSAGAVGELEAETWRAFALFITKRLSSFYQTGKRVDPALEPSLDDSDEEEEGEEDEEADSRKEEEEKQD